MDAAITFMDNKIKEYTKSDYIMSKKERYEFDLIREIMNKVKSS